MKTNKIKRTLAAALASVAMLTAFAPGASLTASASEYKVLKSEVTVDFFGERLHEDEFRSIMHAIYDSIGKDATVEFVIDLTKSPHSYEWVSGGIDYFVDCYFMQSWREMNGLLKGEAQFFIGKGWHNPEGWQ